MTEAPASAKPMTVIDWLGTIVISLVPVVNIAALSYWAIGGGARVERRNYGRAGLIVIAGIIVIVISVLAYMIVSSDPHERIKGFMMME